MSIDHVSVGVTNMKRSKAFYDAVLIRDPDVNKIEAVSHAHE